MLNKIRLVKNIGLTFPKREDVIKNTAFCTAAVILSASLICGIDTMIAGIMSMFV